MEKRIKIESIQIKNFRSIRNEVIKPKDLNILVGTNDAGKSNVLKALNLFFNNQTDYNKAFDFQTDFTFLFPKTSHSTKEIKITIKFFIPDSYSDNGIFTWTKVWRTNDYYTDEILNKKNKKPNPKSRVPGALRRIKYRYVPAVKSQNYYRTLLSELYNAISASLGSPVTKSATSFSDALKDYTSNISKEVNEKLKLISELSVPGDLSNIFQALIFETYSSESGVHIPLSYRGDGLQARHIPIILRYIAEEDQKSRNQGSMKVCTIWGFEEPENGLELTNSFALAKEFQEYAQEIQIFTTTHSPAFYMQKNDENTEIIYVAKKNGTEQTQLSSENTELIMENMGLMPLVAPFIAEQEQKFQEYKSIFKQDSLADIPTILVEGETDSLILRIAIRHHSPILSKLIEEEKLRFVFKESGGGVEQLSNWIICWCLSGFKHKMFALFDKDDAGIKARNNVIKNDIYKAKTQSLHLNVSHIEPSDQIKSILSKVGKFEYEIEHLLSIEFWNDLKNKQLVEKTEDNKMVRMFSPLLKPDVSIRQIIESLEIEQDVKETILKYSPKDLKKKRIVDELSKYHNQFEATIGLKDTLKKMEKFFS